MSETEIVWTNLPGRRWLATVWRPGEREAEARFLVRSEQEAAALLNAPARYNVMLSGTCPSCGQNRYGSGYSLIGGLLGTRLL